MCSTKVERIVLGQEPSVRAGLAALKEKEVYLQSGGEAVFTVTGAEFLLRVKLNPQDEQSDLDKFFGYLQWTREGLREFRYPIAIWVSYRILKEMSRRAPDFWSWRKAVLRFVTESEPLFAAAALEPLLQLLEDDGEFLPPIAELQAEIAQSEARDPQSAGLATLYQKLGQVYARRVNRGETEDLEEERETAIAAFREAIDRSQSNSSAQINTLKLLGNFLDSQSRYTEAIACHQQSLEMSRAIGDRKGEANALGNLGLAYYSLGQYARAIEFHQQSLDIERAIGDRYGEAASLGNLGLTYASLEQYERAIKFYQQALKIKRAIVDRNGEAMVLSHIAFALAKLDRRWEALQNYKQAQQIYEYLKLDHKVEECKTNIYNLQQIVSS